METISAVRPNTTSYWRMVATFQLTRTVDKLFAFKKTCLILKSQLFGGWVASQIATNVTSR